MKAMKAFPYDTFQPLATTNTDATDLRRLVTYFSEIVCNFVACRCNLVDPCPVVSSLYHNISDNCTCSVLSVYDLFCNVTSNNKYGRRYEVFWRLWSWRTYKVHIFMRISSCSGTENNLSGTVCQYCFMLYVFWEAFRTPKWMPAG